MKHGESQNSDSEFAFWILPDKIMNPMQTSTDLSVTVFKGGWQDVDGWKTNDQTAAIKQYLENVLEAGSWLENNHRFFFKNREDYENMLLMLKLGWDGQ